MFKIILFFISALLIAIGFSWLIDNNGLVAIDWLNYKIETDVLTAIFIVFFSIVALFIFTYIISSIFSFRLHMPKFLRKDYLKEKEKIIKKYEKGINLLIETLLALNSHDLKKAAELERKVNSLIKNPELKKFLDAKTTYLKGNYKEASELFSEFKNDNAKNLSLKSKLELFLSKNNEQEAIETAKKIIAYDHYDHKTIKTLFNLYKKQGDWYCAENLMSTYNLCNEEDKDLVLINTAFAGRLYMEKNYKKAIKYAKMALSFDNDFLAAIIILIKSYIKQGYKFRAALRIKSAWKIEPNILLFEFYNFIYKKCSDKKRLKLIKKLHKINPNHFLSDIAVADLALKIKDFDEARNFLKDSLLKRRTAKAYRMMALLENLENGDLQKEKKYIKKSKAEKFGQYWFCSECNNRTIVWNANCKKCNSYNSLIWED